MILRFPTGGLFLEPVLANLVRLRSVSTLPHMGMRKDVFKLSPKRELRLVLALFTGGYTMFSCSSTRGAVWGLFTCQHRVYLISALACRGMCHVSALAYKWVAYV